VNCRTTGRAKLPLLPVTARVTVLKTVSPGMKENALGVNARMLPFTVGGVAPLERSPPRWAEYTRSAAAEPAVKGWEKVVVTALVRGAWAFAPGE
jgi:hypothetical protein